MTSQDILDLVKRKAAELGVDPDLACAIAVKESACLWPKCNTRYEPKFPYFHKPEEFALFNGVSVETEKREQATSWGPMHVMGAVARELGFKQPLPLLFQAEQGIHYGLLKLKQLAERYSNELSVIAAYNAGSPRKLPDGKYTNQEYVDSVWDRIKRLRCIEDGKEAN